MLNLGGRGEDWVLYDKYIHELSVPLPSLESASLRDEGKLKAGQLN